MKISSKTTLKSSLVGSAVGIGAWLFGIGEKLWSAHPQTALFFLTIATTVVSMVIFAEEDAAKTSQ